MTYHNFPTHFSRTYLN